MTAQDVQTHVHGVVALADIPWDMQEWVTRDPTVPRVLTGTTSAPTAAKGWVLGWEERGGEALDTTSCHGFRAPPNLSGHTGHFTGLAGREKM